MRLSKYILVKNVRTWNRIAKVPLLLLDQLLYSDVPTYIQRRVWYVKKVRQIFKSCVDLFWHCTSSKYSAKINTTKKIKS